MTLDDALDQIADIRSQMANTRVFRGFRSATTFFSAMAAVVVGRVQSLYIPDAMHHQDRFFELWLSAGAVCLAVVIGGMLFRYRRSDSPLDRELAVQAACQFFPCLLVGGLFTYVLGETSWGLMWIVPGAWAIFFGLGILSARQLLPVGTWLIGAFYIFCGLISISVSKNGMAFSPWLMAGPFGIGQMMAAGLLYWKLERNRGPQ